MFGWVCIQKFNTDNVSTDGYLFKNNCLKICHVHFNVDTIIIKCKYMNNIELVCLFNLLCEVLSIIIIFS